MIWHYTDANALLGILQRQELWATNARYLNDSTEVNYGRLLIAQCIHDYIQDHGGAEEVLEGYDDGRFTRTTKWWALHIEALSIEGKVTWETPYDSVPETYVSSFSHDGDLLSQWRGYGGGSGFAIGFEEDSLRAELSPNCRIVDVEYGDNARSNALKLLGDIVDSDGPAPTERALLGLLDEATRFKSPAFSEEREVRLIASHEPGSQVDVREKNGELVPYVRISVPVHAVKEIRIGPGRSLERDRFALKAALTNAGFGDGVTISPSKVPFRA